MPLGALYQSLRDSSNDISRHHQFSADLAEQQRQGNMAQASRDQSLALEQERLALAKASETRAGLEFKTREARERSYQDAFFKDREQQRETERIREERLAAGAAEPPHLRSKSARELLDGLPATAGQMSDDELDQLIFRKSGGHFTSFDDAARAARGGGSMSTVPPMISRTPQPPAPGLSIGRGPFSMGGPTGAPPGGAPAGPAAPAAAPAGGGGLITPEDIAALRQARGR